jgi:hypothetical protein
MEYKWIAAKRQVRKSMDILRFLRFFAANSSHDS